MNIHIQWNLRIADGLGPLIISVIRRLGLNRRLHIEWHSTTEPCFYCLYEPNAYLKQFSVVLEGYTLNNNEQGSTSTLHVLRCALNGKYRVCVK